MVWMVRTMLTGRLLGDELGKNIFFLEDELRILDQKGTQGTLV